MNDLQKMQESCLEFAKDLKTGNVVWEIDTDFKHGFRTKISNINVFVFLVFDWDSNYQKTKHYFELVSVFFSGLTLKSTTAREAAFEALEIVKNEAQKLVDALSEPKEAFWIPICSNDVSKKNVLCTSDFKNFIVGDLKMMGNTLVCSNGKDSITYPNHYHDISQYPKP